MKNVLISLVVTVAVLGAYHFLMPRGEQKIGYVRTGELLERYEGMEDAKAKFTEEMAVVQANADTLRNRFERLATELAGQPGAEGDVRLNRAREDYMSYSQRAQEQMAEREKTLSAEATSKINQMVEEYGKENQFQVILGANGTGSLMYGNEADDLTEIILTKLNEQYELNQPSDPKPVQD